MYKGLFEAHITVAVLAAEAQARFRNLAADLGVKAIQIDLSRGTHRIQPMTSSAHQGDWASVQTEVFGLAAKIRAANFEVVRIKVEAHPDNIGVPADVHQLRADIADNYFECHHKIQLTANESAIVADVCDEFGAHLSNNAYKIIDAEREEKFVTLRVYGVGKKEALAQFEQLGGALAARGVKVLKSIAEYCVYDDHVGLDKNWLTIEAQPDCEQCPQQENCIFQSPQKL